MKTLIVATASLAILSATLNELVPNKEASDSVERGRAVYISEGCIHCHSQYARPNETDFERYGPATYSAARSDGPVLIGNRRQGPDLSNVGYRRDRAWQKEHLMAPAALSPGSRMPAYDRLFAKGSQAGEDLLDYLDSLNAEPAGDWFEQRSQWQATLPEADPGRGGELFHRLCAQCHGSDARGGGALAGRFAPPPTDLAEGPLRFAPASLPAELRQATLARIVKYGIPGTPMPGHEYLTAQQIADLIAFVNQQSAPPTP